jgi:ABC-type bacteriocin/lantibiotic exporter with double-glycine peptidase domain
MRVAITLHKFAYQITPQLSVRCEETLNFKENTHICISGESGSGKSSFLHCLAGINSSQGVSFFGKPQKQLDPLELRNMITMVPQEPFFPNLNLDNYLEMINRFESNISKEIKVEEVYHSLKALNVTLQENDNLALLSGGQKQRLAISIALSRNTPILLLDEPTSALDKDSITLLIEHLKQHESTKISVSHNEQFLHSSDEILLLPAGGEIKRMSK